MPLEIKLERKFYESFRFNQMKISILNGINIFPCVWTQPKTCSHITKITSADTFFTLKLSFGILLFFRGIFIHVIRTKEKEFHTIATICNIQLFAFNKIRRRRKRRKEGERKSERERGRENVSLKRCRMRKGNTTKILVFFCSALNHKAVYLLSQMYMVLIFGPKR